MFCPKCGRQNQDTSRFCKNCGKALPLRVPTPQPLMYQPQPTGNLLGHVLEGKYRIEAKLGAGGMGDVYKATRLLIGDSVAIKLLHAHLATNTQAAERFRREAQTAIRLKHRNIITLYDVGISAVHNVPYLLMELAEGLTLRQVIRQNSTLPLEFVVTVTAQICGALEEAHRLGIIHRDIKPENIIVNKTDTGWHIKILDFGIAKLYNQTDIGLTLDGNAMGTPQYMSPEQCLGEELDGRSDLYSTGIVVYEMLCGTVPFKLATPSAIAVHQVQTPPPPPRSIKSDIPPQVETVIMRALEKRREMRQPNSAAFAQELIQAATDSMRQGLVSAQPVPIAAEDGTQDEARLETAVTHKAEKEGPVIDPSDSEGAGPNDENDLPDDLSNTEDAGAEEENVGHDGNEETVPKAGTVDIEETREEKVDFDETIRDIPKEFERIQETEDKKEMSPVFEEAETIPGIAYPGSFSSLPEPGETPAFHQTDENIQSNEFTTVPGGPVFQPYDGPVNSKNSGSGRRMPLLIGAFAVAAIVILSSVAGLAWLLMANLQTPSSATSLSGNYNSANPQGANNSPVGMTYVRGGEFMMGTDRSIDEKMMDTPAHKVTVKPFFIDLTEVTNEEYQKFIAATKHQAPPDWKNGDFEKGKAKFPVTGIDWDDANAYAKWAGKRLPTEEEWEFAARGDAGKIYPWGDDWNNEYANADKQRREMLEVGKTTGRSPFGLSDMSGNAWEWTASDAKAYTNGKIFDSSFIEPKIIRGGFWGSSRERATATFRRAYGARNETEGYGNTGFRCVKDIF